MFIYKEREGNFKNENKYSYFFCILKKVNANIGELAELHNCIIAEPRSGHY